MKKMILILSVLTISSSAFADICGIVTKEQGERALSFLTKGTRLTRTYALQTRMVVKDVTMTRATPVGEAEYYDLKVNGESIDPGHTNIVLNKNVSLNLGALVGCDPTTSDPDVITPSSIH